jgi:hypothetical protein
LKLNDNTEVNIYFTVGVEGRPPDIWLSCGPAPQWEMIHHLSPDEARELAQHLIVAATAVTPTTG